MDAKQVKQAAAGRWVDILSSTGIDREILDGRNHACPRCGGTDRFRLIDQDAGAVFCNQCFASGNGDGLAAVRWMRGGTFPDALRFVADQLGIAGESKPRPRIVATYDYRDAGGTLIFRAVRFEPKDFRQRAADGSWKVKGLPVVPYRLPELLARPDETVFVVEGEKDADNLAALGIVATCNAGGAGKWRSDHAKYLKGRRVCILPDHDKPGQDHAEQVAQSLLGVAESVRVLELPGLPPKGDVSNWLDAGGTAAELMELVEAAAEWTLPTEPEELVDADPAVKAWDITVPQQQTDTAHARRFVELYQSELLYIPQWKKWLAWDGKRWRNDSGMGALRRGSKYAESLWYSIGLAAGELSADETKKLISFGKSANDLRTIQDFIQLAACDERVLCDFQQLDKPPHILNCQNGTVDMATGELRQHDPADRLTKVASVEYDPAAECPQWEATLNLIFDGDAGMVRYLQQLIGYSCSGDIGEHVLPICWGDGRNGKSTIWNTVYKILGEGEYAGTAAETLLMQRGKEHATELADLWGRRFVTVSEGEHGDVLKESRVKSLTGDCVIKGRRMQEDFWEFQRTCKFWMATNHKPKIGSRDLGIWRRIKLIPFTVDIAKRVTPIPDMVERLVASEGPGILAWIARGFQDWQRNGFIEPPQVTAATDAYKAESDSLAEFFSERCVIEDRAEATAADLYQAYKQWIDNDKKAWSKTTFGRVMAERFVKAKSWREGSRGTTVYQGIRLLAAGETPKPDTPKNTGNSTMQPVATSSCTPPMENPFSIGPMEKPVATSCTDDSAAEGIVWE